VVFAYINIATISTISIHNQTFLRFKRRTWKSIIHLGGGGQKEKRLRNKEGSKKR